jgi:hypothetical protein
MAPFKVTARTSERRQLGREAVSARPLSFYFPTRPVSAYLGLMPFPDPFNDPDRPAWQERAEAAEYWVMATLVAGAWCYGIYCGLRDLIS